MTDTYDLQRFVEAQNGIYEEALRKLGAGRSAHEIFGSPDDVKFRSCMTLFGRADPRKLEFGAALAAYFDGEEDPRTLQKLASG